MVTPKVIFRYSWIYDKILRDLRTKEIKSFYKNRVPSFDTIYKFTKKIENVWIKDEKNIVKEISKITGLRWKEKEIPCYVVCSCRPFSDPLTIPAYLKYPDYFVDVLTHELIHQIMIQNMESNGSKKLWRYIHKKYKCFPKTTRIHIPIHAIHKHIYLKFFNEKRLKRDIKFSQKSKDYKKSWDIVEKEGYENIIKELKKITKSS